MMRHPATPLRRGGRRLPAALLAAWLLASATLAPLGDARAEIQLDRGAFEQGLEVAIAVKREIGFVDDEDELQRIYDLGARIAYAAHDDETVYTFYVVDMPEPNAFAVPGGYIFITRGMLDLELDVDALAHLLGHEVAHVRNRHASRIGFWSTVTSILQAAVMFTVAAAASSSGGNVTTYEDEYGREHTRYGGADALASASVVSAVFREFFLRGYSRGLETEADQEGGRVATAAGFDAGGGVGMLEALHNRVYEGGGYSYWRTHPYFTDRLVAARSRLWRPLGAPDSTVVADYRTSAQQLLSRMAQRAEHDEAAIMLYKNALRWGAHAGGDVDVELQLLSFRVDRERKLPALERRLGPVQEDLRAVETRAHTRSKQDTTRAGWEEEMTALAADVQGQLDDMLPRYLALLDTPGAASTPLLQRFVENFPDHRRAGEARLALGRRFMADQNPEDAVPPLMALLASDSTPDSLRAEGLAALATCTRTVTDLSACYEIVHAAPDAAIGGLAAARMDSLTVGLEDLEIGGRFLGHWQDTPYTDRIRDRVESLARSEERFGRVYEAGGKPQRALDIYNRVVLLAPNSEAAVEAIRGIERIHQMGKS